MAAAESRPLALVTGASSGIGYELARECANHDFDLLIAADEPEIHAVASELAGPGIAVEAVQADLAPPQGIERLWSALPGVPSMRCSRTRGVASAGDFSTKASRTSTM